MGAGTLLGDFYRLDGSTLQWTRVVQAHGRAWPGPRWGHQLAWIGGRVYLFGGWNASFGERSCVGKH